MTDYHEIALLIDGLRSDDSETRLASASRVGDISRGLGEERTREVSGLRRSY